MEKKQKDTFIDVFLLLGGERRANKGLNYPPNLLDHY